MLAALKQAGAPFLEIWSPFEEVTFGVYVEEKPQGIFHRAIYRTGAFSSDPNDVVSKKFRSQAPQNQNRSDGPVLRIIWSVLNHINNYIYNLLLKTRVALLRLA